MKKKYVLFLLGTFLISFLSGIALSGEPKVKKQDPVIFFWYHFRSAVISNNLPKLQELTLFPFETTTSDGTVVKNPKGTFANLFRPLLDTSGNDGKTMREHIEEKEDLTEDERAALKEGEIRVASFRFRMVKNNCFFVGAGLPSPRASPGKNTPPHKPVMAIPVTVMKPNSVPPPPVVEVQPTAAIPPPLDVVEPEAVPPPAVVEADPVIDSAVEGALVNLAASPPKTEPFVREASKQPARLAPPPEPAVDPRRDTVFRFFWVEFRQAVLDNDVSKIKSLTRFPFETKGPLEDDRTKKVISREFDLLWPRLLETDPHSWGPLRDSMKELIARRDEPRVEEISTEPKGEVQIGVFVFRKIKNRWLFTRAIIAE